MFNIGDKVRFINWENTNSIPGFFSEDKGIPEEMIFHGNIFQKDSHDGGVIEGFYSKYVIVSYLDKENNKTQLGFLESSLLLVKSSTDYEIY